MSAQPSTNCYISSNSTNLRVRLIGEPLTLAKSMSERWDVRVLRSNGTIALKLRPVRSGGILLADYKPGGCDLTLRRPEDLCTFGPTCSCVEPDENGASLLVRTMDPLAPFNPSSKRGAMSPISVVYKSPPKSIDQLILEMTSARETINAAKKALGDDLDMKIDEAGELRITYVRVL